MKLKINHNAAKEAERILRFPKKFLRPILAETTKETLEVARLRTAAQITPGGGVPGKRSGVRYIAVTGANVQRKNKRSGKFYGKGIFHKSRVVSRTGNFLNVFKNKTAELIMSVTDKGTGPIIGKFGVQGKIEKQAKGLEFGRRGKKGRKPIWKGLQWANKRFLTILAKKDKRLETAFRG